MLARDVWLWQTPRAADHASSEVNICVRHLPPHHRRNCAVLRTVLEARQSPVGQPRMGRDCPHTPPLAHRTVTTTPTSTNNHCGVHLKSESQDDIKSHRADHLLRTQTRGLKSACSQSSCSSAPSPPDPAERVICGCMLAAAKNPFAILEQDAGVALLFCLPVSWQFALRFCSVSSNLQMYIATCSSRSAGPCRLSTACQNTACKDGHQKAYAAPLDAMCARMQDTASLARRRSLRSAAGPSIPPVSQWIDPRQRLP